VRSTGCISYTYGDYGLFRNALPRHSHVICLPEAGMKISGRDRWLPFEFDGHIFKAKKEPFPPSAFTRAFVALLDLLPTVHKLRLVAQPNYLAGLQFRMPTTNNAVAIRPFTDVVIASLADEVARDFGTIKSEFPNTRRMVKELKENPNLMFGAAAPSMAAMKYHIQASKWRAFPWCCGGTASRRGQLKSLLSQMEVLCKDLKDIRIEAVDEKRGMEKKPLLQAPSPKQAGDAANTLLSNLKSGSVKISVTEMHQGVFPAYQPHNMVLQSSRVMSIRTWQVETSHAAGVDKAIRVERMKAWAEMQRITAVPPPTYYETKETILSPPPAYAGAASFEAKDSGSTSSPVVWLPSAPGAPTMAGAGSSAPPEALSPSHSIAAQQAAAMAAHAAVAAGVAPSPGATSPSVSGAFPPAAYNPTQGGAPPPYSAAPPPAYAPAAAAGVGVGLPPPGDYRPPPATAPH
jgi:hypothetical protein